jgi:hypothetical protein
VQYEAAAVSQIQKDLPIRPAYCVPALIFSTKHCPSSISSDQRFVKVLPSWWAYRILSPRGASFAKLVATTSRLHNLVNIAFRPSRRLACSSSLVRVWFGRMIRDAPPGIAASPLPDNVMRWHAVIFGSVGFLPLPLSFALSRQCSDARSLSCLPCSRPHPPCAHTHSCSLADFPLVPNLTQRSSLIWCATPRLPACIHASSYVTWYRVVSRITFQTGRHAV